MRIFSRLSFVILLLSFFAGDSCAQEKVSAPAPLIAAQIWGHVLADREGLSRFYHERGGKTFWVDDGELTSGAEDMIAEISRSWTHGLNPENYHLSALKNFEKMDLSGDKAMAADIVLSDGAARLARDLSGMRLSPRILEQDTRSWSRGVDAYTYLKILEKEGGNPAALTESFAPHTLEYKALRASLEELAKDLAAQPEEAEKVIRYTGLIKHGVRHAAIPSIRKKLGVDALAADKADLYDDDLKAAVMAFQTKNGLTPDGLIGKRSFAAINQTRTQKLVKLIANLERRRWVMRPLPARYLAVNIPQMQLTAVDNNEMAFTMPVIVGRLERPTMSFVDVVEGVRFNPSWYVPDTIKAKDYLPELQKDPLALEKKGIKFRVKDESGMHEALPQDIDWSKVTEADLKSIQMKQDPGEENVLGQIRVLMPNQYDIYLHDTSSPKLFLKDDRALSSGCVRLSEPRKIADFILSHNAGWSAERLEKYLADKKTRELPVTKPLSVYLFYYTAWLDDAGDVIIGDDLYGADRALVAALDKAGKIPFDNILY
ncbi:MAG: L,D-transpeptidase family protein [Pseudobdellovibrionaceae bacterium]